MASLIVFAGYPKELGSVAPPNTEPELVHIRLDKIESVEPFHAKDACQVHMQNGYCYRIAMKADEFVQHFLTVLSEARQRAAQEGSTIIVPPTGSTPQAA
jgi:hypothetical protein